jgi:hypothetical protein
MESGTQNALFASVIKLLRPLVRIFLRNALPYGAFADLARWVYVDVARKEFGLAGRKQSDSRISILTGLSRKEVRHLRSLEPPTNAAAVQRYNRAARVIAGWRRDAHYRDPRGKLDALPFEGTGPNFSDLVRTYSGDVPARAILDELLKVGAVKKTEDGRIQLLSEAYLPAGDTPAMHSILGTDVSLLIETIDHNTRSSRHPKRLQRKVLYDNVPVEAVDLIRSESARDGQRLLEKLDRLISRHDRDVNPKAMGSGRKRVGVGIYYFEEDAAGEEVVPPEKETSNG